VTEMAHRTRYQLDNGITLIIQENHFNPTISIVGYIKAGSIFDGNNGWPLGTSDFVAEMLMNGTKNRSWQEIANQIESVGASIDIWGQRESVGIECDLLVRDLDIVLDVLQDVLRNPSFPLTEIDKHRCQLNSSFLAWEDDTYRIASRLVREMIYPEGHPYHHRVQGGQNSIEQINQKLLVDFHQTLYRPDQLVLVIVGNIDTQQTIQKIEQVFGDWSLQIESEISSHIPTINLELAQKKVKSMMDKSQTDIILGHKGVARSNPEYEALNLMNRVLGGSAGIGRLFSRIRDVQGLAYSVWSTFTPASGEGMFLVGAGVEPNNIDQAINSIRHEIKLIKNQGVTDEELADVQNLTIGNFVLALETNKGIASVLSTAEFRHLGLDYIDRQESIYRQVTQKQVNTVAQKYLFPDHMCLAIAGPHD